VTGEHLDHEKLALLMMTQNEAEANIVKSILKEAGIECVLVTQVPHNIYPFAVDGLAAIQIKVLDSQLAASQALLQEYTGDPELEDPGNCGA
jgi:hypothetical protein